MRDETVARSYAEALLELAASHGGPEAFVDPMETVARALDEDPRFRHFLATPRISASAKKAMLRRVFSDRVPRPFLNFLLVTVDKRRQRLLGEIAREYRALVDAHLGRIHVDVTLAREPGPEEVAQLSERLGAWLGGTAVPHIRVNPSLLGGAIIRTGDTIHDGSLRRRLDRVRRRLLTAELPART